MAQKFIKWVPSPKMMQRVSKIHIKLYKASGGLIGSFVDDLDILLLTTRGRKSGQLRTAPLPYFKEGDRHVVIASNGGGQKHPAWYLNLSANPDVEVQVGMYKHRMRARTVDDETERSQLWKMVTKDHPRYDRYKESTKGREIPVVVLELR
jgi:deazaflavin-dependent oxidoreductase (nitroreductase family)